MQHRRLRYLATSAIVLSIAISACGGGGSTSQSHNLVVAAPVDSTITLDPHLASDVTGTPIVHAMYSSLTTFLHGDSSKVEPQLASSWELGSDGLTWTFHLRKGILFSSGNQVTAQDVVYSLERIVNVPKNPSSYLVTQAGITADNVDQRVLAVDDSTVQFKLSANTIPAAAWLSILPSPALAIVDSKVVKLHAVSNDFGSGWLYNNSAGSGPFMLDHWTQGSQIKIVANPKYNLGPKPQLTSVLMTQATESSAQYDLLKRGGADIGLNLASAQLGQAQSDSSLAVIKQPSLTVGYIGMNEGLVPAFRNPKVLQAVKWAIDTQGLAQNLLGGYSFVEQGPIPKGLFGYASATPFTVDTAKAKQLLSDAGFPKGFSVQMLVPSSGLQGGSGQDIGAAVQSDLAKIGVTVNLQALPVSELLTLYRAQKAPMVLYTYGADYPDADNMARVFGDYNQHSAGWRMGFNDPSLIQMLNEAALMPNNSDRESKYAAITQYMQQNAPFAFIYQPFNTAGTTTHVHNVYINPLWLLEIPEITKD